MKTNILTIIMALLVVFQINAQALNQEISDDGDSPFLLGKINKNGLEGENYTTWFTKNYNDYKPNITIINAIASELKTYSIKLFMGTWCGDSKKEVPRLYKVLEACNFPLTQLENVALSRKTGMYKQSPQHEEAGLNIHRVPTVIFYKNGKEINRIVEHPKQTFEKDIEAIITNNNYKSNYQIVADVHTILQKNGIKGLKKNKKQLLRTYKGKVKSMYELNTYGYILFTTEKQNEAISVLKLNTKLFPNEPNTFVSLSTKLAKTGHIKMAKKSLKKALKLDPKNKLALKSMEALKSK
ncbi:MAG: thioredoxin family protein [Winogradskyella sp.]